MNSQKSFSKIYIRSATYVVMVVFIILNAGSLVAAPATIHSRKKSFFNTRQNNPVVIRAQQVAEPDPFESDPFENETEPDPEQEPVHQRPATWSSAMRHARESSSYPTATFLSPDDSDAATLPPSAVPPSKPNILFDPLGALAPSAGSNVDEPESAPSSSTKPVTPIVTTYSGLSFSGKDPNADQPESAPSSSKPITLIVTTSSGLSFPAEPSFDPNLRENGDVVTDFYGSYLTNAPVAGVPISNEWNSDTNYTITGDNNTDGSKSSDKSNGNQDQKNNGDQSSNDDSDNGNSYADNSSNESSNGSGEGGGGESSGGSEGRGGGQSSSDSNESSGGGYSGGGSYSGGGDGGGEGGGGGE